MVEDNSNPNTGQYPAANLAQLNANDALREVLVQMAVQLIPIIIKNFLTDEMIKQLIARLMTRIAQPTR